ncbi:hypothetical protein GOBAR_DD21384 [Gossypium barbadense]|nr:hypothetical protein GOBAR_DD21384 [Gossypium barbadense]
MSLKKSGVTSGSDLEFSLVPLLAREKGLFEELELMLNHLRISGEVSRDVTQQLHRFRCWRDGGNLHQTWHLRKIARVWVERLDWRGFEAKSEWKGGTGAAADGLIRVVSYGFTAVGVPDSLHGDEGGPFGPFPVMDLLGWVQQP